MMREAVGTGPTVEEAKEAACRQLGVDSYEAEFEILQMPVKKTFGLFGGSPAKVRVYIKENPAEKAAAYLKKVLSGMGVQNVSIRIQPEEGGALLSISGSDVGFVIGHRGETLDALQYLAGLVANHSGGTYFRIALDIGNYREKRRRTLSSLGKKLAEKSLRTGRNIALEPMNPYERRIIHTAVSSVDGAKSWSEGEDLERHVVVGPVKGERPRRGNSRRGDLRKPQGSFRPRAASREKPDFRRSAGKDRNARKNAGKKQDISPEEKPREDSSAPLYGRID